MALSLKLENIVQSNDATVIRAIDTTGLYDEVTNPGGWLRESDSTPATQPKVSVINGTTINLYLDVTITTSNGTETTYDQIDLYDEFGPFEDSVNSLSFDLDPSQLVSGSQALGNAGDQFPDGWYSLTYSFVDSTATYANSSVTVELVIDGKIRQLVYNKLRDIPYSTSWTLFNHDFKEWYDILYPMYYQGLHTGMLAEVSNARKNEILDMMATLERLLNQITS